MVRTVSLIDIDLARAHFDRNPTPLPEAFRVRLVYGRDLQPLTLPVEDPDRRTPVVLAHYGAGGILPTLADLARILCALCKAGSHDE